MKSELTNYKKNVKLKYNTYNGIFQTLGLDGIHKTGILLPIFAEYCKSELEKGSSPLDILNSYVANQHEIHNEEEKINLMFRFIQFIERQVVLVDSLEDAEYSNINDLNGPGSVKSFFESVGNTNKEEAFLEALKDFRVRIVLTAHPTQFYPGSVLGIIKDLSDSMKNNDLIRIESLLAQLGYTPFFKKQKPTPYDEAVSLIWFLENNFYKSIPPIYLKIADHLNLSIRDIFSYAGILQLGFWPGGDRDGNPFVNANTTAKVAARLRKSILKCYYRDVRDLKRKLTFDKVEDILTRLENNLYQSAFTNVEGEELSIPWFKDQLERIVEILKDKFNGIYVEEVDLLALKLRIFGFHFASLDIRQDDEEYSSTLKNLAAQNPDQFGKINLSDAKALFNIDFKAKNASFENETEIDTFEIFKVMQDIKANNGELGCHRIIVSHSNSSLSIANVYALAKASGWEDITLDFIPLFETIEDLEKAGAIMDQLYSIPTYRNHVTKRNNKQIIMLGFSDGTKDGGYLTANWSIYRAKEEITKISRKYGIKTAFFDGRGGPPARGGGNTHKFYASLGDTIESNEIQLTIQGQTISSNYGTVESSGFNMEQLFTAGMENLVLDNHQKNLTPTDRSIIEELSERSKQVYIDFKSDPLFISYLENRSTLKYYSKANIGSRPSKRGKTEKLTLNDLRAIPFVGAWSQLKQNVPGFYVLGTVFNQFDKEGRIEELKNLYKSSLFFKALLENSMQSLCKTHFPLTQYMSEDKIYGSFWNRIFEEYKLSVKYLLEITGQPELLYSNLQIKESIKLRENIVLPLLVIQQYGLIKIKDIEEKKIEPTHMEVYEKIIIRSLYGNINASRNSA